VAWRRIAAATQLKIPTAKIRTRVIFSRIGRWIFARVGIGRMVTQISEARFRDAVMMRKTFASMHVAEMAPVRSHNLAMGRHCRRMIMTQMIVYTKRTRIETLQIVRNSFWVAKRRYSRRIEVFMKNTEIK